MGAAMRVKVCGLTRLIDLRQAEWAGAEYVGFIVEVERSPRSVPAEVALALRRAARAKPVFVVAGMDLDRLAELAGQGRPAAVQLHGSEGADYIKALRGRLPEEVEIWRAVGLEAGREAEQLQAALRQASEAVEAGAARILLDAAVAGQSGGTGRRVALEAAAQFVGLCPAPVILAGGLRPEVLEEAWKATGCWALDLSSGLEREPGIKDGAKMRELARVLGRAGGSREQGGAT